MERLVFCFAFAYFLYAPELRAQVPIPTPDEYGDRDYATNYHGNSSSYQAFVHQVSDDCNTVCQPQQAASSRRVRLMGGYEFGWLQPRFSENVSAVVSRIAGDQAYVFDHSFENTPRVWIGE